jgi:GNAT superfamily N-acetyltransferase
MTVRVEERPGLPDGAQAQCLVDDAEDACSLWWKDTPAYANHRVGLIGHFSAANEQAGVALLEAACSRLRQEGCTLAIAPMDGNTWRRYRVVTGNGAPPEEPPFFLEPRNPAYWPSCFERGGFGPLARYYSSLVQGPLPPDERVTRVAQRAATQGYRIESAASISHDELLHRIYAMSVEIFTGNFLYSPQSWDDYVAQYSRIVPVVRPEFVLLCTRNGEDAGFLFAIPDAAQTQRGVSVDTLIIKTAGVLPAHQGRGLGSVLTQAAHQAAWGAGYRRVIHALMHEANQSNEILSANARRIREYILFSRTLR